MSYELVYTGIRGCCAGSQTMGLLHASGWSIGVKMLTRAGVSTIAIMTHIRCFHMGQVSAAYCVPATCGRSEGHCCAQLGLT